MKIAKSSEKIVLVCLILTLLSLITLVILLIYSLFWYLIIPLIISFVSLFLIWTFRDPDRKIEINEKFILAPADGILSKAEKKENELSFTIRMSPFDVHMNRAPISGIVKSVEFKKGSHWPVYFPHYAKRNQRNTIVIENEELGLVSHVIQVSGIFARRTVAYVKPGDEVIQGQKIGTIRFGSITHLTIRGRKNFIISSNVSQSVRSGVTILAQIK